MYMPGETMDTLNWDTMTEGALAELLRGRKTGITIGVFDGIHRGHQVLVRRIVEKKPALAPTVITFNRNPKEFLKKQTWEGDILSLRRKLTIFENLGVEAVVLIDFSVNFSRLSGREFMDLLIRWANPGYVAVGANFKCGYRMDTDAAQLRTVFGESGVPADVVQALSEASDPRSPPVSSSRIRAAISRGDLKQAEEMLGRRVEFDFTGINGELRRGGRFFGTASLGRITPAPGVYGVLLYPKGSEAGVSTQAEIDPEGILVSQEYDPERIEFYP
jgi:riboflavin kinase/FMN adenylyltransferase